MAAIEERDFLIEEYFKKGFTQTEIRQKLIHQHGYNLSLVHLKRIMKRRGLHKHFDTPIREMVEIINKQMRNNANMGQNAMWKYLQVVHCITIQRDTVRQVMKLLDPEGTEVCKAKRLIGREYYCPGPNFVWHVDGFDKLKPYELCIHGTIDGFSRKVLWLEVAPTNNNPRAIVSYYLNISEFGGIPRVVRSDMGTENALIKQLQIYLRINDRDTLASFSSFIQGKSTSNQRIEALWCIIRKMVINSWMNVGAFFVKWLNVFKDMKEQNIYNDGNIIHVECLKFCFMDLLRLKLDEFVKYWNLHKPRNNKHTRMPNEKADIMLNTPQLFNARDMKTVADLQDTEASCSLSFMFKMKHFTGFTISVLMIVPSLNTQHKEVKTYL